jgi:DNA-binding LytR/AlgR family response regulator
MDSRVKRLERYISDYEETICGHKDGEHMYINIHNILYFETVDNKCFLYTHEWVLEVEKKLYELEKVLDPHDFFRCSKSMIVNINQIIRLKPEMTRNILATMSNGEVISISRRYAKTFKELIQMEA